METYQQNQHQANKEKKEQERSQKEYEAYEKAMEAFKKSRAHKYIMDMIDEKLTEVTDTRCLAKNFGMIKGEISGDLGILGTASLMAAKPLEELKEELQ